MKFKFLVSVTLLASLVAGCGHSYHGESKVLQTRNSCKTRPKYYSIFSSANASGIGMEAGYTSGVSLSWVCEKDYGDTALVVLRSWNEQKVDTDKVQTVYSYDDMDFVGVLALSSSYPNARAKMEVNIGKNGSLTIEDIEYYNCKVEPLLKLGNENDRNLATLFFTAKVSGMNVSEVIDARSGLSPQDVLRLDAQSKAGCL